MIIDVVSNLPRPLIFAAEMMKKGNHHRILLRDRAVKVKEVIDPKKLPDEEGNTIEVEHKEYGELMTLKQTVNGPNSPSAADVAKRRRFQDYAEFMVCLAPSMVTQTEWRNRMMTDKEASRPAFTEYIKPTYEAFIIIVLENFWNNWFHERRFGQSRILL